MISAICVFLIFVAGNVALRLATMAVEWLFGPIFSLKKKIALVDVAGGTSYVSYASGSSADPKKEQEDIQAMAEFLELDESGMLRLPRCKKCGAIMGRLNDDKTAPKCSSCDGAAQAQVQARQDGPGDGSRWDEI